MDRRPTAHLTNLPPELLAQVCAQLCTHCTPTKSQHGDREWCAHRNGLLALARSCRTISTVAQAYCFHQADGCVVRRSFLHVILRRPDLAGNVKRFNGLTHEAYDVIRAENLPSGMSLPDLARIFKMDLPGDANDSARTDHSDRSPQYSPSEFLIAGLPNLETLSLYLEGMGGDDRDSNDTRLAARFKRLGTKPSLPRLRALQIGKSGEDRYCLSNAMIGVLLAAAGNLESLAIEQSHGFRDPDDSDFDDDVLSDDDASEPAFWPKRQTYSPQMCIESWAPALASIRRLVLFDTATDFGHLIKIIKMCPNLVEFTYNGYQADEYSADPLLTTQLITALEPLHSSLETLDMEMSSAVWEYMDVRGPGAWQLPSSALSAFTSLRVLRLDEKQFCVHRDDTMRGIPSDATGTCLTDHLPKTVRHLTVRMYRPEVSWVDLKQLGHVAQYEFPLLQSLVVDLVDTGTWCSTWPDKETQCRHRNVNRDAVLQAFASTSVRVQFRDRYELDTDPPWVRHFGS